MEGNMNEELTTLLACLPDAPYKVELKSAIEELVADAEKWRAYKARKDAVIAALHGENHILGETP